MLNLRHIRVQSASALTNFSVFADVIVPERLPSAGQEPSTQQEMTRLPQVPLFSFGSGISVGFSEYRVGRANRDEGSQTYWTFYVGGKWVSVGFTGMLPYCATLSRSLPRAVSCSFLSLSVSLLSTVCSQAFATFLCRPTKSRTSKYGKRTHLGLLCAFCLS